MKLFLRELSFGKTFLLVSFDDGFLLKRFLSNCWKLKDSLNVRYHKDVYFFDFGNEEERSMVLDSNPCVINGKGFIITRWSPLG